MVSRLAMAYFGGAVASLVASITLWATAQAGLLQMLDVSLAPPLSWDWLSPRLLWGSIYGLGYPAVRRRGYSPVRSGIILSLLPSAIELFIFMPGDGQRFLGLGLGSATPLVVLTTNALWGWGLARILISKGRS